MGLRRLIYIPNEETWLSIQEMARRKRRSASNYLIWLHDVHLHSEGLTYSESVPDFTGSLDRSSDPDKAIKKPLIVNIEEPEDLVEKVEALVTTPADEDIPHDANFKQGEESLSVVPKTVEEVKERIEEILDKKPDSGFFSPHTKEHQARKKKK